MLSLLPPVQDAAQSPPMIGQVSFPGEILMLLMLVVVNGTRPLPPPPHLCFLSIFARGLQELINLLFAKDEGGGGRRGGGITLPINTKWGLAMKMKGARRRRRRHREALHACCLPLLRSSLCVCAVILCADLQVGPLPQPLSPPSSVSLSNSMAHSLESGPRNAPQEHFSPCC